MFSATRDVCGTALWPPRPGRRHDESACRQLYLAHPQPGKIMIYPRNWK
ncbi:hypothetical protein E2C01_083421 [Portunus trituberculatus]|uniref:Uncharacterized protein n=1 Tax=Portunus trituberculatus TaxID=210409 RepID=A0A5B7J163_PORTR|nr:hypothetical protein [Portunus trituberculatus]